jgi:aminocarboxymuconate-semialdehyde decarboxylase
MFVVDAHAHIVPAHFPELSLGAAAQPAGWPSLLSLNDGRGRMMIDGHEFRTLDRAYFDLDSRLALMDREAIDMQVVSPLPELLGYWLDTGVAVELARLTNESVALTQAAAPRRIAGLGMLPLQDISRAVAMVDEIVALGLRGIQVGSNVNGRSIADPACPWPGGLGAWNPTGGDRAPDRAGHDGQRDRGAA